MKTGIIIPVRMSSTRFPGKAMAMLAGKPVIEHVIERCKEAECGEVILAIGKDGQERTLVEVAEKQNVAHHVGPCDNVLERFQEIFARFELDRAVRVNGDSPLIDPHDIRSSLQKSLANRSCYVSALIVSEPDMEWSVKSKHRISYPEVFSRDALDQIVQATQASLEHITWLMHTPVSIRAVPFKLVYESDIGEPNTVDTPKDLERLESRWGELCQK